MTQQAFKKLKQKLPTGWPELIAEKAEVSKSTVYKVLDGKRKNPKVINVAIQMAAEESQKNNEQEKCLNALLK